MRITNKGVIPQPSTVDFVGLLDGGKFIAFDAKQTKIKTRLPIKNIHQHQLDYLKIVQNLGGITFFLVWFTELSEEEA
jgi:recombination protein U